MSDTIIDAQDIQGKAEKGFGVGIDRSLGVELIKLV